MQGDRQTSPHGFLCALWFLLIVSVGTAAAQQPADTPSISVSTRLVILDTVVTDADGKPVQDLQRGDFTVLEDGVPRPIRNFDAPSNRPTAATTPSVDRYGFENWGAGVPLTVYVLDELNTPFDEEAFAADNLRRYLASGPDLLLLPAMLVTVNFNGLATLSPYTRSRDTLLRALSKRAPALPAAGASLDRTSETLAMLRQIAMAAEGMRTHVNVVWLGRGFPSLDPTDFNDKDSATLKHAVQDTVNLLQAARITLYQVDPITIDDRMASAGAGAAMSAGMAMTSSLANAGAVDMLDQPVGFDTLAVATGGTHLYGRNDLDRFLAQSSLLGREFYTLTYVPRANFGGKPFHDIRVVVNDPRLHVKVRSGFYTVEPPAAINRKDLGFDLKLAATSAMHYSSVGVQAVSVKRVGNALNVDFCIHDRSLRWTPRNDGSESATVTVLLVSLDRNGEIATSTGATLHLAVKNATAIAGGQVDATEALKLNAASRQIRLVVRDASGLIGTSSLELPH